MATLKFNGSSQYVEFLVPTGSPLIGVTAGPHTVVAIYKRTTAGTYDGICNVVNAARTTTHTSHGYDSGNQLAYDSTRASQADVGTAWTSTTEFRTSGFGINTADTPDVSFHSRNHTTGGAFTHSAGFGGLVTPGYAGAGTPAANDFIQIGRWQTGDYYVGDIAIVAIFGYRLSNTNWDDICTNDKTSDIYACPGGAPLFLCELNAAHGSLVDLMGNATLVSPVTSPTLTGADPDRWTFDGTGFVADQTTKAVKGVGIWDAELNASMWF